MATQAERRAKTRGALIGAAKKLFEEQGFDSTSVDQIITLANVAKGTFYQYFETKLDLLMTMEREAGSVLTRRALEAATGGEPALPMLEAYLGEMGAWFERWEKVADAIVFASLKTIGDERAHDPHLSGRGFTEAMLRQAQAQGALRADVDARELAKMVAGFITIEVLAWRRDPQPGALAAALKRAFKLFLEGAQAKDGKP